MSLNVSWWWMAELPPAVFLTTLDTHLIKGTAKNKKQRKENIFFFFPLSFVFLESLCNCCNDMYNGPYFPVLTTRCKRCLWSPCGRLWARRRRAAAEARPGLFCCTFVRFHLAFAWAEALWKRGLVTRSDQPESVGGIFWTVQSF